MGEKAGRTSDVGSAVQALGYVSSPQGQQALAVENSMRSL